MARDLVVTDVSFAVKWFVPEPFSTDAARLLRRWHSDGIQSLAPALFAPEFASALMKKERQGILVPGAVASALSIALRAVRIVPDDHLLIGRAVKIATDIGAGKAYDSLYAALAEREGCDLWTGDERFFNAARDQFAWVRWVGNA